MKLSVKNTYIFTIPLRHTFYVKIRTFLLKNYGLFYKGKITDFFTREKLRTFLQGKNYGLFTSKKLTDFLQIKNLRAFLVKTYGLFTNKNLRTFYK